LLPVRFQTFCVEPFVGDAPMYLGGFRMPARANTRDLRWPASGNLHHCRSFCQMSPSLKADVRPAATSVLVASILDTRPSRPTSGVSFRRSDIRPLRRPIHHVARGSLMAYFQRVIQAIIATIEYGA
jgi:hypothetical protein